jgi:hypothetical protein
MKKTLQSSRALWNRMSGNIESDEVLAQLLDRGEMPVWREIYRLASTDEGLRARIHRIVLTVPLSFPHFWLGALASLGEPIDWNTTIPDYFDSTSV